MPSTEGSAQPPTTLEVSSSHPRISSFGVLPFPRDPTRVRVPLVSLWCGHRRATERSGLYQTQPLNHPLGAPRRAINLHGFWLGLRTWVWCLPARSRLYERTNEVFGLPTTRGQSRSPEPSAYTVVGFGETTLRRPSRRPYGRLYRQGPCSKREGPTTDVEAPPLASQPLRRRTSLRKGVSGRLRTNSSLSSPCERHRHPSVPPTR